MPYGAYPRIGDIPLELGQWLGITCHHLASEIPKGSPKLKLSRSKKAEIGLDFQGVTKRPPF